MRLKSLALQNFRCFTDEIIRFDAYTALVGANNAGKSAIIGALDIFFRSNPKSIPISIDDFFKRDTDRELRIALTFADLNDAAKEEFSHYARAGELTFFVRSRIQSGVVQSSLHGMRLANPDFAPFFELPSAAQKKVLYEGLQKKYELDDWQNQTQAAEALRHFENSNAELNMLIPSDDKAFGVEGPVPKLRQFIDFVYIPAVKDAGDEAIEARNTAFSRLIERAVRAKLKVDERIERIRSTASQEIDAIANDHEEVLENLVDKIGLEYRRFNPSESNLHLEWSQFDSKNLQINLPAVRLQISDDLIRNSIERFGHGIQRSYLMALLMVSASYDFTDLQTIIIACEEPELYQHPPQERVLAIALHALASSQAQVVVSTHSPHFVTARSFDNIRLVRRARSERSKTYSWSIDENRLFIAQAKGEASIGEQAAIAAMNQFLQPQMNEMFFAPCVVFVEGDEDRAILSKYLQLSGAYPSLLAIGFHIVPTHGKGNMINALSIANGFKIPHFAIFDGDMHLERDNARRLNRDIMAILQYSGPGNDGSLNDHVCGDNFFAWKDCLQTALNDVISDWEVERLKVCQEFGWTIDRLRKNAMVLEATLERVYKGKPIANLDSVSSAIVKKFIGAGQPNN